MPPTHRTQKKQRTPTKGLNNVAFKVALSAGHYLGNPKRCHKSLDPNETREWWLNDRIADKLEKLLAEYNGIEVLRLDDTTGKKYISNEERARIANNWKADLYLAIHHNAADRVFNGGGITAYIHSTNAKPGAAEWQKAFYDACIKYTGLKGNRATPLARAKLRECSQNCPSVLMELGFMDSTVDVPIILTDAYATKIAKALAEVIVERCGASKKASNGAVVTLPILVRNSRGESVRALQSLLNLHGASLTVDGSYGPATEKAVKEFQTKNGLSVDGKCGPITWGALLT